MNDEYIEDNTFSLLPSYIDSIKAKRAMINDAAKMLKSKIDSGEILEQECPVTHRFTDGLYMREIFMPKGTRIVGKIHSTEHFNVVLTGRCTVITAEGIEEIKAPHTFISKAGVQKVVVVHDDCQWQTLHVTNKTNVEEIEKEVIAEDYDQLKIDGLLKTVKRLSL